MATALTPDLTIILPVFIGFFAVFIFLGFYAARWRKGDLSGLFEWGVAGRRLGWFTAFFLFGADWYTAFSILSVPSSVFTLGAFGYMAVTYQAMVFAFAILVLPRLWAKSKEKGYLTLGDTIKGETGSKALSIFFALVGIGALVPYIALQVVGLQGVLVAMFFNTVYAATAAGISNLQEAALIIAFVILAGFTFTSGLRGATLGSIYKDILVWISLIALVAIAITAVGGFAHAFANAGAPSAPPLNSNFIKFNPLASIAFSTSMLGTALSYVAWPHNVNNTYATQSRKNLKLGLSLAIVYAIPLFLADTLGVIVNQVPAASAILNSGQFNVGFKGILVIPAMALAEFNSSAPWFAAIVLVGVFIGGLVPAAIMAIAQGNLLARNVVREFKPNLTAKGEAQIAKWSSAVFKFAALGVVAAVPPSYNVQFYYFAAAIVIQGIPATYFILFTKWFRNSALLAGGAVGVFLSILFTLAANKFAFPLTTTIFPILGPALNAGDQFTFYVGVLGLGLNLIVVVVGSAVINAVKPRQAATIAPPMPAARP
ncbi:MAG: sodium:solute symporter [archaeon]|nr:sodium:solute symporter [archaeon]